MARSCMMTIFVVSVLIAGCPSPQPRFVSVSIESSTTAMADGRIHLASGESASFDLLTDGFELADAADASWFLMAEDGSYFYLGDGPVVSVSGGAFPVGEYRVKVYAFSLDYAGLWESVTAERLIVLE